MVSSSIQLGFICTSTILSDFLRLRPVPGHEHLSEHSLLLVPEHKFGHCARARALAPEVVLEHRAKARALI